MQLLYECGNCSNVYKVPVQKFTGNFQKLVCPSCRSFHYFGQSLDSDTSSDPTIENLTQEASKDSSPGPTIPSADISWKCGVCSSPYHFNLDRTTESGVKITCTTCFQFFILQRIHSMVDMDQMVMTDSLSQESLAKRQPSPQIKKTPPAFEEEEVSQRFRRDEMEARMKSESLAINPSSEPQEEIVPFADSVASAQEEVAPVADNIASSQQEIEPIMPESQNNFVKSELPPQDESSSMLPPQKDTGPVQPAFPPRDEPVAKEHPAPAQGSTEEPLKREPVFQKQSVSDFPEPEVEDKPIENQKTDSFTEVDQNILHSFASFQTTKGNFKIDENNQSTTVTFSEHGEPSKKNVIEKNMIQVSVWIISVSILSFGAITIYDWIAARRQANLEKNKPAQTAPRLPQEGQPKFGFPDLGD